MLQPPCSIDVENVWGPRVHGCGTDFDLTLLFQEVVVFTVPLSVAICWACCRIWQLICLDRVVALPVLLAIKISVYSLAIVLQIALLGIQVSLRTSLTRATIASSCVGFIGLFVLLLASCLEHGRSVRASTLLLLYLAYSIPTDALRARTLWSMPSDNIPVAAVFTALCVLKFLLLILERTPKTVRPGFRRPTPDEQADVVSRMFLWWMLPLFSIGKARPNLTSEALPNIEHEIAQSADPLRARKAGSDESNLHKSSIFSQLFAARGWLLLSAIPSRLCYSGLMFAQPFLVRRATEFLSEPQGPNTYKVGGGLIAAYLIVFVGLGVTQAFYRQCTARTIAAMRADLVTWIYHHALKLGSSSSSRDAASNLMSADVERFAAGSRNMHECWGCILEAGIGLWLLQQQLGVAIAATGGLTLTFVVLTGFVLVPAGRRQSEWLKSMETRIAATAQALRLMKGVKMTGITSTIRTDLSGLRVAETRRITKFRYLLLVVAWAAWIPVIMTPILGFTVYNVDVGRRTGRVLTPAVVYSCLTIMSIFGDSIADLLDSAVNTYTAAASLVRIQKFLQEDNRPMDNRVLLSSSSSRAMEEDKQPLLLPAQEASKKDLTRLRRLSRRISQNPIVLRLHEACAGWNADRSVIVHVADLEVSAPMVVAVIGQNGSGKTTLLQMLLGETQRAAGSVAISTGRIGYCSQTPWLINDSIRNNIVGSAPFEEGWYKTVIRATSLEQDFRTLSAGDKTTVGEDGSTLSGGQKKRIALARAIYIRAPIVVLDDPFNGLDLRTEAAVVEAVLGSRGLLRQQRALVIWATSTERQVRVADRVYSITDAGNLCRRDSLSADGPRTERASITESGVDQNKGEGDNRPLSIVNLAPSRRISTLLEGASISSTNKGRASGKKRAAYKLYLGEGATYKLLVFVGLLAIFVVEYWAVLWAEHNVANQFTRQGYYIGLYFTLGSIQLIAWTTAMFFFMKTIAEKSSELCHTALLDAVSSAPMPFFDTMALGNIINRFSQDLQLIDTELPLNMMMATTQIMVAIGQYGLIVFGAPWSAVAIPVVAVACYFLQRAYLPTSSQLRLLEIEAKAPLFSHFLETLSGVATIRALQWTTDYTHKNKKVVENAQKPFYLLFAAQNWLNLVMDLITAGLAVVVICVGVAARSQAHSTFGLALFSVSGFGSSAKRVIQWWTQLEISMGAVERVRDFTVEMSAQQPADSTIAAVGRNSEAWHGRGSIQFRNVSAKYKPFLPPALQDVSFEVQPGQRCAICGRTGSGKSTLLSALLRLIPLSGGSIWVDDTDLSSIDPDRIRSRFTTLPQEPLLVYGTVRHNMQLFEPKCDDNAIIAALDDFGLWNTIQSAGGLDVSLTEELLSHGQRQLFCFARSTLQQGNMLVLDEASSQSDPTTEERIQGAIRERFKHHTILCIAHKLNTILDFDTVIVMDTGSVAESGSPRALLEDPNSLFSALWQAQKNQTGQI